MLPNRLSMKPVSAFPSWRTFKWNKKKEKLNNNTSLVLVADWHNAVFRFILFSNLWENVTTFKSYHSAYFGFVLSHAHVLILLLQDDNFALVLWIPFLHPSSVLSNSFLLRFQGYWCKFEILFKIYFLYSIQPTKKYSFNFFLTGFFCVRTMLGIRWSSEFLFLYTAHLKCLPSWVILFKNLTDYVNFHQNRVSMNSCI